jgi:tetratricopeptide (TPR) repeat protein
MFDQVPVRVWLLIAIAAMAHGPAQYVYRHLSKSPSALDLARVPEDWSWRTESQFNISLLALCALSGLAVFIFTPAAAALARSPSFVPMLMAGLGLWALATVFFGAVNGRIEPFVRGVYQTYERDAQPKRFWASMVWNGLFASLCFWLAATLTQQTAAEPVQDRCFNQGYKYSSREALSACDQLIDKKMALGRWTLADVFMNRGIAYANLNDQKHAIADYSEAIRKQPDYFEAYYNRGLAYQQLDDSQHAIADYTAAIRLKSVDADAHYNRGLMYLRRADTDRAIADFTTALKLNPKFAGAYYSRGWAYRDVYDERAEADFAAAVRLDPRLANAIAPER